jgi:rubrerythrin
MNKKSSIESLIQKENDLINKYREFASVTSNEEATILCKELTSKHNLHISELQKYLER